MQMHTQFLSLTALYIFRSHPPSMPVRRWPLTAVSMTMTLSWPHSPGWLPPQPKTQTSAPRRELVCGDSDRCEKTWTCWSATATWSTRTRAWPSLCPTCSSTPSTGACTPDPALPTNQELQDTQLSARLESESMSEDCFSPSGLHVALYN